MAEQALGLSIPNTMLGALLPKPPFIKHLWATTQMLPVLLLTKGLRNRPCFCSEGKLSPALSGVWTGVPNSGWPMEMIHFHLGRLKHQLTQGLKTLTTSL